jgi:hypothetical protein
MLDFGSGQQYHHSIIILSSWYDNHTNLSIKAEDWPCFKSFNALVSALPLDLEGWHCCADTDSCE